MMKARRSASNWQEEDERRREGEEVERLRGREGGRGELALHDG